MNAPKMDAEYRERRATSAVMRLDNDGCMRMRLGVEMLHSDLDDVAKAITSLRRHAICLGLTDVTVMLAKDVGAILDDVEVIREDLHKVSGMVNLRHDMLNMTKQRWLHD